ncbi:MAG TPA: hypothetical protein VNZ53_43485 [Steroidobacteraceae bacterium]|nr:hypothetical protein [Steroidobacteraceae bacterium]
MDGRSTLVRRISGEISTGEFRYNELREAGEQIQRLGGVTLGHFVEQSLHLLGVRFDECAEDIPHGGGCLIRRSFLSAARLSPVCHLLRHIGYCVDVCGRRAHHSPVRLLTHIKKLDDCFGQFLVRVICNCGACREIEPEALARLVGWKVTLKELAPRMRCSRCGKKAAEVVAVARPRPRGVPKNPH